MVAQDPTTANVAGTANTLDTQITLLKEDLTSMLKELRESYDNVSNIDFTSPDDIDNILQFVSNLSVIIHDMSVRVKVVNTLSKEFKKTYVNASFVFNVMGELVRDGEKTPGQKARKFVEKLNELSAIFGVKQTKKQKSLQYIPYFRKYSLLRDKDVVMRADKFLSRPYKKTYMVASLVRTYEAQRAIENDLKSLEEFITTEFKKYTTVVDEQKKELIDSLNIQADFIDSTIVENLKEIASANGEINGLLNIIRTYVTITSQTGGRDTLSIEEQDELKDTLKRVMDNIYKPLQIAYNNIIKTAKELSEYAVSIATAITAFDNTAYDKLLEDVKKNTDAFADHYKDCIQIYNRHEKEFNGNVLGTLTDFKDNVLHGKTDANQIKTLLEGNTKTKQKKKRTVQKAVEEAFSQNGTFGNNWFAEIQESYEELSTLSTFFKAEVGRIYKDISIDFGQQINEMLREITASGNPDSYKSWPLYKFVYSEQDGVIKHLTDGTIDSIKKKAGDLAPGIIEFIRRANALIECFTAVHNKIFDKRVRRRMARVVEQYAKESKDALKEQEEVVANINSDVIALSQILYRGKSVTSMFKQLKKK